MPKLPYNQEFTLADEGRDWRDVQVCRGGIACQRNAESRIAAQNSPGGCPNCLRQKMLINKDSPTIYPPVEKNEEKNTLFSLYYVGMKKVQQQEESTGEEKKVSVAKKKKRVTSKHDRRTYRQRDFINESNQAAIDEYVLALSKKSCAWSLEQLKYILARYSEGVSDAKIAEGLDSVFGIRKSRGSVSGIISRIKDAADAEELDGRRHCWSEKEREVVRRMSGEGVRSNARICDALMAELGCFRSRNAVARAKAEMGL